MSVSHPPRGGRRRVRAAAVLAVAAVLGATAAIVPAAHAGQYPMYNCNAPAHFTGNRGPWYLNATPNGVPSGLATFDSCAGGGSFGFTGTQLRPGQPGVAQLARPGSIAVTGLKVWFRGSTAGTGSPAYTLMYADGVNTVGWDTPVDFSSSAYTTPVLPSSMFEVWTFCGNNAGQTCNMSNSVPLSINGVEATLSESAPPAASIAGGTLTTAGAKKGAKTVSVTGADGQSGVRKLEVFLDDTPAGAIDYGRDWARPLSAQKPGTCAFDTWNACPGTQDTTFSVDTTAVPDGAYALSVKATDAAGNVTTTTASTPVTVDNTAPGAPSATSALNVSTEAASTDITWSHPNGQIAPITAAHVTVGTPSGQSQDIVVPVTGATGGITLNRIDGYGLYTVKVALEDEAGNYDPAQARTYRVTFAQPSAAAPVTVDPPTQNPVTPIPGPKGDAGRPGPSGPTGAGGANGANGSVVLHLNGANATASASIRATFIGSASGVIRSAYGKKVAVTGRLVTPDGKPITGAKVSVLMQDKMVGAKMLPGGEVVTDGDGRFRFVTTATRSRTIRFAYRAHVEDVAFAQTTDVSLGVIAKISLGTSRTSLRNGQTVVFRGSVAGAPANARKVVELQVRKGKGWMTFRTTRLRKGRFSYPYRFTRTRGRVTYTFRARVRQEAGFPFLTGTSKHARVTVRG